jgi:hypothetical protein
MTNHKINFNSGEAGMEAIGLIAIIVIAILCTANFHIPNSGQHTGYVSSVEQSGIIWKTWTAYIKTDPQSSQEDTYCVTDQNTVTALKSAATNRGSLTVYYSVPLLTWKWQCGGEQSIIQSVNTSSANVATTQQPSSDSLSSSFTCPEVLQAQDLPDAYAKFISSYQKLYPSSTVGQMFTYRYRLLVSNSCNQSLENMLQNVDPVYSPMIRFVGKDFGPQTIEFSKDTKVWTAYYPLDGQGPADPDEELIFNFYLKNIWTNGSITAKDAADNYVQNSNTDIIYKFTAPDTITKNAAYSIYSDKIYPQQNYAYIYVTKISSIQDSAFAVTYSKKITGDGANLKDDVNNWLAQDLKGGASTEIGNVEVDPSWINYLSTKGNNPLNI